MPIIAVLNRKGGSGKSTLATNIAGWCAANGWQVMLGDVDRQQSVRSWLQRRHADAPPVLTWVVDQGKVFRAPKGTTHVVLDTPGAIYDYALTKVVVWVDAIVVPIGPSIFDRDASIAFIRDLQKHPRVASGKCKLIAVGMRWPSDRALEWLTSGKQWDLPLLTVIPEKDLYRNCLEAGGCLFDLDESDAQTQMTYWKPLLDWLTVVWSGNMQLQQASNQLVTNAPPNTVKRDGATTTVATRTSVSAAAPTRPEHWNEKAIPAYLLGHQPDPTLASTSVEPASQVPACERTTVQDTVAVETPAEPEVTVVNANARHAPTTVQTPRSWLSRLLRVQ